MLLGPRVGWPVLLLVAALALGVRADDPPNVHSAVTAAVADGRVAKTKLVGFSLARDTFAETNSRGGVLIGFDLGVRKWFDRDTVSAFRPIYRMASGNEAKGESHGSFVVERDGLERVVKLRARPGYAVSGLRLRSGLGIDAVSLDYARVSGDRLDAKWTYQSEWVGNVKGGNEGAIDCDGMAVVGVFGNRDRGRVVALGLVNARLPGQVAAPPKKKNPVPVVERKPVEKPAEKPVEKPATAWTFRHQAFSLELPPGWVAAQPAERPAIQAAGVVFAPDAAFRDATGETFVLLRTRGIQGQGRTLDELGAELTPSAGQYRATAQVTDAQPGEVVVDRARRRFAWRATHDVVGGRMEVLYVCHVGTESAVTLECLARPEAYAATVPTFARVAESARLEADMVHREPPRVAAPVWVPIAVFLGVSAVVFVPCAVYLSMKKNAPPARRRQQRKEIPYAELAPEDDVPSAKQNKEIPYAELAPQEQAFAPSTGIVASLQPSHLPVPPSAAPSQRRHDEPVEDPFTCVGERAYRVYVLPGEVYFIDDGPGDLNLSGKFAVADLRNESEVGAEHRLEFGQRPTADDLFALADGETNFRVKSEDVWQATIEAPGYWDALGEGVVGTLRVGHRARGEIMFRFRGTSDMRRAIELLRPTWGHCLAVQATWDAKKKKFVREA